MLNFMVNARDSPFILVQALDRRSTRDVLPPATRHGVPRTVICSEGYRRLQELDGKCRETTIYTGLARRKVMAPYVQSDVDSILRPALFVVLRGMLWL